ncbi:hypothetical protein SAMD00019534_085550 [Acytostelium subglobosum LB1]|uniref:hypothetical protein n=1 Tax=Acytostelium subglobosum LB1 TaxID=1410327 RepID=UPI000644A76B|nr:hypothetical protein SAMD00019534_085550 [Acytostelium subglobosum LB1]GAM25380.1 hypothetical protein SAMD00019534_085550 [Acytostelium subglobosum LB1]|eukprot:XP_012751900.1 hypothetical protein SAMD00019534_085550 [Acytostelium subglobosum LB1]
MIIHDQLNNVGYPNTTAHSYPGYHMLPFPTGAAPSPMSMPMTMPMAMPMNMPILNMAAQVPPVGHLSPPPPPIPAHILIHPNLHYHQHHQYTQQQQQQQQHSIPSSPIDSPYQAATSPPSMVSSPPSTPLTPFSLSNSTAGYHELIINSQTLSSSSPPSHNALSPSSPPPNSDLLLSLTPISKKRSASWIEMPSSPSPSPSPRGSQVRHIADLLQGHLKQRKRDLPLFLALTSVQKTQYVRLLKINIPKVSQCSSEESKTSLLFDLYLKLMDTVNHPTSMLGDDGIEVSSGSVPVSEIQRTSCKLMALEDILEASNQLPSNRLVVLTGSTSMLSVLEEFCTQMTYAYVLDTDEATFKSYQQHWQGIQKPHILLSTFDQSSSYHQYSNSDIVVHYDHYWQQQTPSTTAASTMDNNNNNTTSMMLCIKLIGQNTVENWAYNQDEQQQLQRLQQDAPGVISPKFTPMKDKMVEMMKYCIVKMSSSPSPTGGVPMSVRKSQDSPSPLTSPSLPGSHKTTPSLAPLYVQAHDGEMMWRSPSPKTSSPRLAHHLPQGVPTDHSSINDSASLSSSDLASSDKKKRSNKRQKNLLEKCCFICKQQDDAQGNRFIVLCRSCPMIYHRLCAGLAQTPRSWKCPRHTCSKCKKTSSDTEGSFFLCKDCPCSYCFACLPNDITILDKSEYSETKNEYATASASSSTTSLDESADSPGSLGASRGSSGSSGSGSGRKTHKRPMVYMVCGGCKRNASSVASPSPSGSPMHSQSAEQMSSPSSRNPGGVELSPSSSFGL